MTPLSGQTRTYVYRGRDGERVPKRTKKVTIDKCVTVIRSCAFSDCISTLKCVSNIHDDIRDIGHDTFFGCKLLRHIVLPRNLESIGARAFYGCRSLEAVFLPQSLKCIKDEAFGFCSKLMIISIPETVQVLGENILRGCIRLPKQRTDLRSINSSGNSREQPLSLLNRYRDFPLHELCYRDDVTVEEIDQCLQQYGPVCASIVDDQHMTAMHVVASNPHASPEVISAIVNANPEVVSTKNAQSLKKGQSSTVWKWILESPKEFKHVAMYESQSSGVIKDKYGSNALHYLCEYNPSLLSELTWLEQATTCFRARNKTGITPLQVLIKNGNIKELLLKVAIKCHLKWEDGMEAIFESALVRDFDCILAKDKETGLHLFMLAAVGINSDLTTIYKALMLFPDLLPSK